MDGPKNSDKAARVIPGDAPDAVAAAVAALRSGNVIVMPTDTVYGLVAAIDIPAAIQQLYSLKQRPESKAIPVLLSDIVEVPRVCAEFPELAQLLARL